MLRKEVRRKMNGHKRKRSVVGDNTKGKFVHGQELRVIAVNLFSPVGKNPYYRGEKTITNFKELNAGLNEFTENEAQWVASWIEYLGDAITATRIRQTPDRFREIIKIRFNELLPYAS
jgi:hypothetical protein